MTKSYHLTQEQIAQLLEAKGYHGAIGRQLVPKMTDIVNAALDQVLGEPFGIWHVGETEDESDFYLYEDAGDVSCDKCIKLYAPRSSHERPDD